MHHCCVIGCSNKRGRKKGVTFHRIPAIIRNQGKKCQELSSKRRSRWIAAIKREQWMPNELTRLCSEHFTSGKPASLYDTTNSDWVPHLNMGYERHIPDEARHNRFLERQKKRKVAGMELELSEGTVVVGPSYLETTESEVMCPTQDAACQTLTSTPILVNRFCQTTIKETKDASCQTDPLLDVCVPNSQEHHLCECLESDAEMLKFYTGIHEWCVFIALFNLVVSDIHSSPKLSKFEMFVLFFMKIRLNLFDEDLAYRFKVHRTTVSRTFKRILNLLAEKTKDLIKWPARDTLRLSMPMSFRKFFRNCCVIIDCTEVFIERPTNLLARAQVWSNYKHHSTLKFLIGITPQGTISYVSQCVGGRMSDKEIVEKSNLIDHLLPGDVILADRGFTCNEYYRMALAEVKTPPFTKGKKQLEKVEVDWSRELSTVRIHVERVIGVLKQKYTILQGTLPISVVMDSDDTQFTIDKIVRVCCALVNLCPSVVPQD